MAVLLSVATLQAEPITQSRRSWTQSESVNRALSPSLWTACKMDMKAKMVRANYKNESRAREKKHSSYEKWLILYTLIWNILLCNCIAKVKQSFKCLWELLTSSRHFNVPQSLVTNVLCVLLSVCVHLVCLLLSNGHEVYAYYPECHCSYKWGDPLLVYEHCYA